MVTDLHKEYLESNTITIQEKLGYEKNAKLLVIHADDFGLCNAANMATIQALENGFVNSVSIMPPCPWFLEAITYAQYRPAVDLGVHLTLTCEWSYYKWGPVAPRESVPSLLNEDGYFYDNADQLLEKATIEELEIEILAQIEKVFHYGVKPTHIDSHMMVLLSNVECTKLYHKISKKYNLPILLGKNHLDGETIKEMEKYMFLVDQVQIGKSEIYHSIGLKNYYEHILRTLSPGLTILLLHPAFDNLEMQSIAAYDTWKFGARWRQQDYDFFTSAWCGKILKSENISLVSWREIGSALPL
jgi:predicted glycoside hydrolase/deacetylase ChbG (UPF0249 family)